MRTAKLSVLPDGGAKLKSQIKELEEALGNLSVESSNVSCGYSIVFKYTIIIWSFQKL